MAHVQNFEVTLGNERLLEWFNLGVSEPVFDQIQLLDRDNY